MRAGRVGHRAGNDHGQALAGVFEQLIERKDRRLGVERVEDGLDQEEVGTALSRAFACS
jgi:hypothetical protein